MISRRNFFRKTIQGVGLGLLWPSLQACHRSASFPVTMSGPNATMGHRLRTMDFPPPTETLHTDILIVGGGIAGLSAARYLKKYTNDFMLLELEQHTGGNAMGGSNAISAFPWGAHYLPLPGNNDPELVDFLKECDVITGTRDGLPIFNEYYLCHDPKERLFINHHWQDSLIPHAGIPQHDRDEIERFMAMMHDYKNMKGDDARDAFAIPVALCSRDKKLTDLDTITATEFLRQHGFASPYLHWYINYCCADDYGTAVDQTSAWAMIHYFASRKASAANATSDAILTWPEGNYWLAKALRKNIEQHIHGNSLVYEVSAQHHQAEALVFDGVNNTTKKISARTVIMATPQFINQRLLKNVNRNLDYSAFQYAPWMVANMVVNASLNERRGETLCWDNVIYGSSALGYVNASHQLLGRQSDRRVITYYKPPLGDAAAQRKAAFTKTPDAWKADVLRDLSIPHRDIEKHIEEMTIWLWGHGMVKPSPGFTWSSNRINAHTSIGNTIHFAHSDLSGLSIFEEAFYHGHQSAKAALQHESH